MIVEIRDLIDGRLKTIATAEDPWNVQITIGRTVYRLSDVGVGGLLVRANGPMRFVPGAHGATVIEVDES